MLPWLGCFKPHTAESAGLKTCSHTHTISSTLVVAAGNQMHIFGICITTKNHVFPSSYHIISYHRHYVPGPSEGSPRGPEKVVWAVAYYATERPCGGQTTSTSHSSFIRISATLKLLPGNNGYTEIKERHERHSGSEQKLHLLSTLP